MYPSFLRSLSIVSCPGHRNISDHSLFFDGPLVCPSLCFTGIAVLFCAALYSQVVCPQQLDQFFWAERVRYLAVGSVLERALFAFVDVERAAGPAPAAPPGPLVCQAAAAVLSALTPQVGHRHYVKETEMIELDLRWCGDLGYHTKGCGYHAKGAQRELKML